MFLGGARDPDAASLDDAELTATAVRGIAPVLGISSAPQLASVYRWLHAGAQHVVGHLERMQRLERRLESMPGLFVAGSGFRAIGIPDCVAEGRAAAMSAVRFAEPVVPRLG